jgi:hypothetical protein
MSEINPDNEPRVLLSGGVHRLRLDRMDFLLGEY